MKSNWQPVLFFGIPLIISFILCYMIPLDINGKLKTVPILTPEFVLNFLAILLGFALTIIAIIYSLTESFRKTLTTTKEQMFNSVYDKKIIILEQTHKNIKNYTIIIFFAIPVVIIVSIAGSFFENVIINKMVAFFSFLTLSYGLLAMYHIFLNMYTLFKESSFNDIAE